jgi:type III restriction enzyme
MPDVVIENPVINSPFEEPRRHFRFTETGITSDIDETRRRSSYFIPIPPPKKGGVQAVLPGSWTSERLRENEFINNVRSHVDAWREGGWVGLTRISRSLLDHWRDPDRERRLFFCQIEALETAMFLAEVAPKSGLAWIENDLRRFNEEHNPGLYRMAFKMATGSGKTVVMAMLIAWQSLNKLANPKDARFADTFLVVTPGITIRDRLRVLQPNDQDNYYEALDLVPADDLALLNQATILVTNFHQFIRQDTVAAASLTKKLLAGPEGNSDQFKESPDVMVRRVCRAFGSKRNIVVLNDEAHHCYRPRSESEEGKLTGDERTEAKENTEAARVWISGLEAVKRKIGIRAIYDLSATPFFLRGSGYPEGTLFPWVVSDFSLIDAIESGIVKVPRVPVADDQMTGDLPTYRDLWVRIRDGLPRKGRASDEVTGEPKLPKELEGALISLYGNYEKAYKKWHAAGAGSPPVFIVVCSNTNVSKMVFDWIAGYEKTIDGGGTVVVPGALAEFNNEDHGTWRPRPNTLLIDSAQLESGEAMNPEFKRIAAAEIEEFKRQYRGSAEDVTDEDLLREVMNTIGRPGRLGEHVRCVVSVSMLTEGWDANTVTHILGIRAFGTQLLCEQVVGRGLRRMSYEPNADGRFEPEYAEVYGVPFSFIPTAGTSPDPKPPKPVHRVQALPGRADLEIAFPRLVGYRYELPADNLTARFTRESGMTLSTAELPSMVELDPIAGTSVVHDLADLRARRMQEVAFRIAKVTLDHYLTDAEGNARPWLFPPLFEITTEWLNRHVRCKDGTFPQMLLLAEWTHAAAAKIYRSVFLGTTGEKRLIPIVRSFAPEGSTAQVSFDTVKNVFVTRADRCHINYVVADTFNWEQKLAQTLESMPETICYVKNERLGFLIPYVHEGRAANYMPDYIVRVDDGGPEPLNLIVEVSGMPKKEKKTKVWTAKNLWVPAVNNHGGFGRWAFVEVTDPWNAEGTIRAAIGATVPAGGR